MDVVHSFTHAVAKFRTWAEPRMQPGYHRTGEWECAYQQWREIYEAWQELLKHCPVEAWSPAVMNEALYAIARDNDIQELAKTLTASSTASLLYLTEVAMMVGEGETKWQLAHELSTVSSAEMVLVEPLLARLVVDADEYVRRQALWSLALIGSTLVERFALREWATSDSEPWTRINVLDVLAQIESPTLSVFRRAALVDSDADVRITAEKMPPPLGEEDHAPFWWNGG